MYRFRITVELIWVTGSVDTTLIRREGGFLQNKRLSCPAKRDMLAQCLTETPSPRFGCEDGAERYPR